MNYKEKYNEILAKHIKAEFEGFRNLLKKKGIDYEPQQVYWDDFARLYLSSAKKYVEQKPINWTELTWKDINDLERIINNVHYEFRNGTGQESFGKEVLERFRESKGDDYVDEQKSAEVDESTKRLNDNWMKQHFDDYKERKSEDVTDIIYNAISEVCHTGNPKDFAGMNQTVFKVAQRVAEMCQKQEWSEKDEVAMRITMDWLIEYRDRHANLEETKDEIDYCIDWLKSLRPQPQGIYQQVVKGLRDMCDCYEQNGMFTDERARDFLANVRVKCKDAIDCAPILDEPSWKPNKEQMEALESAVKLYKDTHFEIHHEKIVSLYEQLKKLM